MRMLLAVATLSLGFPSAFAEVQLAPIFTNGVVLQQQTDAPIWGWAAPGEAVVLKATWLIDGVPPTANATADKQGLWSATLPTPAAGGPFTLEVAAPSGSVAIQDVLVGEVWICSGQSNMEWPIKASDDPEATAAAANDPKLRVFVVNNAVAARPGRTFPVQATSWRAVTPAIAPEISAVGYFFGRSLRAALDVPVGLVVADWGGTPAEAWTPSEALKPFPRFAQALAAMDALDPDPAVRARKLAEFGESWWTRLDELRGAPGKAWAKPEFDDSSWGTTTLPAPFSGGELERFDGVVYLRRAIELPADWVGKRMTLELGPIDDRDEAFVNGTLVGGTREDGKWSQPRRYQVPAGVLRPGRNVVAVRVLDTGGTGGVNGKPGQLRLLRDDGAAIALGGPWKLLRGVEKSKLPPMDGAPTIDSGTPAALWNGMMAPLAPMAARGAIWYQGESNRYDPALYARLFPAMIEAWRARFGKELWFHFVQIAPFAYGNDRGETAALREAQAAALELPRTTMTVTLDVGEPNDIHPRDKRSVGERLAAQALATTYGRPNPAALSRRFSEASVEDGRIRLHFEGAGALKAGPDGLDFFVVAGDDRRFFVADAAIEGETVVVSSPMVPRPAAVRYAWSAAPRATLFSAGASEGATGLPIAPFRTDRWETPAGGWPNPEDGGRTRHLSNDPAFVPLFDGKTLDGWTSVNCAPQTWSVRDGRIFCTGVPTGLLRTDQMHENYVLELEWRHLAAQGNAGLFIWSDALTAPGQPFSRSVEVQVMVGGAGDWYTSDGDIFPIHGATMTPENGRGNGSRAFPTERRMKPAGEWNHYTVTCENGAVSLAVNGKVVTRGRDASPRKGYICLESEGTPIEFRNIRLKPLPSASPPLKPEQVATAAEGFVPLYGGVDLAGWKADPANEGHWQPRNWVLAYDGKGNDLWTERSFKDFQMIVDWRLPRTPVETEHPVLGADGLEQKDAAGKAVTAKGPDAGDSGIYLRGSSKSQVNIWCWPAGSGEVYGYRTDAAMPAAVRKAVAPASRADKPLGEWNRFLITMKGDRLTVVLNGVTVIENAQLPDVAAEGPIGLQSHGDPIEFANLFIREL